MVKSKLYLNNSEEKIVMFLYEYTGWVYKKKISKETGLQDQTTMKNLRKLTDKEIVEFKKVPPSFKLSYYGRKFIHRYKGVIWAKNRESSIVIETPELILKDGHLSSHYVIDIYPISKKEFEKKAFIVDNKSQIRSFIGTHDIKWYRISSKSAFGTRSSGGMPNYLSVTIPERVYKKLKIITKIKNKYYKVSIGDRQMQSLFSYGKTLFIKGGSI
ncbi:hypothetical protein LCGC14_0755450 [marine sediment metagenome]|uniref:Uncharacterized protein n=1 Tax=marine sediment metagenome TaxID=412755 RepID=A0A0F9QMJ8_9ZZZZ